MGETGGKNFIFVHPTVTSKEVAVNAYRGAFEYQEQKCSAVSRMHAPISLWPEVKAELIRISTDAEMGDVLGPINFVNAVIDEGSYENCMSYINYATQSAEAEIFESGKGDKNVGYFVEPTIIVTIVRNSNRWRKLYLAVLTIFVYEDHKLQETIDLCDTTSPYGLTGAIFARKRVATSARCEDNSGMLPVVFISMMVNQSVLLVGLQPFGGSRASGTNDKAGGEFNLIRWISPRIIKETFLPATDYRYPYMIN
ncbi:MAG: aldehyde dehydrogenase family protein [Bacteroidales bacterium]